MERCAHGDAWQCWDAAHSHRWTRSGGDCAHEGHNTQWCHALGEACKYAKIGCVSLHVKQRADPPLPPPPPPKFPQFILVQQRQLHNRIHLLSWPFPWMFISLLFTELYDSGGRGWGEGRRKEGEREREGWVGVIDISRTCRTAYGKKDS